MLAYVALWLVTLAVALASLPQTIRMLRSPEWKTNAWLPSSWRYWPLLLAPVFVAVVGLSVVFGWGNRIDRTPTAQETFVMAAFLVAASIYVLAVSAYNSRQP